MPDEECRFRNRATDCSYRTDISILSHLRSLPRTNVNIDDTDYNIKYKNLHRHDVEASREESAALGWRMPWANRLFPKSMKLKILHFLHEIEKIISVISIQV